MCAQMRTFSSSSVLKDASWWDKGYEWGLRVRGKTYQDTSLRTLEEENMRICAHITHPHLFRSLFWRYCQPS